MRIDWSFKVMITERGRLDWWEDPTVGRVVWRYICMENGEPLLDLVLVVLMLMWFAVNLDMILDVRIFVPDYRNCNNMLLLSIDGIYTDKSRCCARHGVGTGPIHMNYLACSGTEFKLVECNYSNSTSRHSSDWGVTCRNGNDTFKRAFYPL